MTHLTLKTVMDIVDYGDSQEHTPNYADLGIQQTNNIQTTIFGMVS